jgi:hypothetical protein
MKPLSIAAAHARAPEHDAATYADAVAERVAELLGREQQLTPVLVDVAGAARLLED